MSFCIQNIEQFPTHRKSSKIIAIMIIPGTVLVTGNAKRMKERDTVQMKVDNSVCLTPS